METVAQNQKLHMTPELPAKEKLIGGPDTTHM